MAGVHARAGFDCHGPQPPGTSPRSRVIFGFHCPSRVRDSPRCARSGQHFRHTQDATERGFKDTVKANPGYFTTVRAKYDLPMGVTTAQTYVYHCHILEHEDNDMMRPFTVHP